MGAFVGVISDKMDVGFGLQSCVQPDQLRGFAETKRAPLLPSMAGVLGRDDPPMSKDCSSREIWAEIAAVSGSPLGSIGTSPCAKEGGI